MKNRILKKIKLGSNITKENQTKWDGRVSLEMDREVWESLESLVEVCRSAHNASLTGVSPGDHKKIESIKQNAYEILGKYLAWEIIENIDFEESLV